MAKKKLPGHKWYLFDEVEIYFLYKCRKCNIITPNSVPLPVPFDEECS